MIRALFQSVGNLAKLAAAMAFITGVSLFLLGAYLCTYPLMRLSPREKKLRASADFASAGLALFTAFASATDQESEVEEESEVTQPYMPKSA